MAVEEPDWTDVLELVTTGHLRVPSDMGQYVQARAQGIGHEEAAKRAGLDRIRGYTARRRLIDAGFKCRRMLRELESAGV